MNSATADETSTHGPLTMEHWGSGPRLVFVHGFTQAGASWRHLGARLADRFEVVGIDLPGHGASAHRRVPDLPAAAGLLGESAGRATYIGYSLGGRVCLRLALDRPELVERLVLIGATAGIADVVERVLRRRRADEALADTLDPPPGGPPAISLDAFFSSWLKSPLFTVLSEEQADLEIRRAGDRAGLAFALRCLGTGTQVPLQDRLGALSMPVELLAGERDEKFRAIADEMGAAIGTNARVEIVAGADHAAPFSQPERFYDVLCTFLAEHPSP